MSMISFEGIGEVMATIYMTDSVEVGKVVRSLENDWVRGCSDGDLFCGVAVKRNGYVGSMQVKGFVRVPYTGDLKLGWKFLVANDGGGVREGTDGVRALVIQVDEDNGTAVICL